MGRYIELFRIKPEQYIAGSPVIIEAGALQKDTEQNKVLAQIKNRNVSDEKIIACKVKIRAFEPNGNELKGIEDYSYLDLNVPTGGEFGSKVPVYLPDIKTREFSVKVLEVVFSNKSVWTSDENAEEWNQIPPRKTINEYFLNSELIKQYNLDVGENFRFVPENYEDLFLCSCGAVTRSAVGKCCSCHRTYDSFSQYLDRDYMQQRTDDRIKREKDEEEERKRAAAIAEEQKRKQEETKRKKRKKILFIFCPITVVVIVLAYLTPTVIIPKIKNMSAYSKAEKLLNEGMFDDAQAAYDALGDYNDSRNMVFECQYQKAESYLKEGKYEDAMDIWKTLGDYSDSPDRIINAEETWKENDYLAAEALVEANDFMRAKTAFEKLDGYKDSKERAEECIALKKEFDYQEAIKYVNEKKYKEAVGILRTIKTYKEAGDYYKMAAYGYAEQLVSEGKYDGAISHYVDAIQYKDAADRVRDLRYIYGCKLMEEARYEKAIEQLSKCQDYKDARDKLLDAEFGYVSMPGSQTILNTKTYNYLNILIKEGYPGAKKLYDEIFGLKIEVTAVNNSEDSMVNCTRLSRYDTIYYHYKVVNGVPGKEEKIVIKTKLPNANASTFDYSVYAGVEYWVSSFYTSGGASGTASVTFYDSKGNVVGKGSVSLY
ncbi:MAG: hypothetical protein IJM25_05795 [Eubacterium sp.]|nr:hypothetical protein [Eubacterium sp.]